MVAYFHDVLLNTYYRTNQWEFKVTWKLLGRFCVNASDVLRNAYLLKRTTILCHFNSFPLTGLHSTRFNMSILKNLGKFRIA
jgi:hypothetical protein